MVGRRAWGLLARAGLPACLAHSLCRCASCPPSPLPASPSACLPPLPAAGPADPRAALCPPDPGAHRQPQRWVAAGLGWGQESSRHCLISLLRYVLSYSVCSARACRPTPLLTCCHVGPWSPPAVPAPQLPAPLRRLHAAICLCRLQMCGRARCDARLATTQMCPRRCACWRSRVSSGGGVGRVSCPPAGTSRRSRPSRPGPPQSPVVEIRSVLRRREAGPMLAALLA